MSRRKLEMERDFTLHDLEVESKRWMGALATCVQTTTVETFEAAQQSYFRLDYLLDEFNVLRRELGEI